jgi:hypothetical protein
MARRGGAPARPAASPGRGPGANAPLIAAPVPPIGPGGGVYFIGYYPNVLPYPDQAPAYDPSAYANGYAPPPNAGPAAGPPPPPAYYGADPGGQGYPSLLVNPNYVPETAHPLMRDYSYLAPASGDATAAAQPAPAPSVIFLIAMKDDTIHPAIAYWVQNNTLNYITQQGVRNQVPLSEVDREFSTQLNKERNIDFALPEVNVN